MSTTPWMKFYPTDWRADPLLRSCDPLSRYLWLEMVGLMHEGKPYGHLVLNGKPIDDLTLARLAGMPLKAVRAALKELGDHGVYSLTDAGVIFSRRMVRDEMRATSRRVNGAKGGNPALKDQSLSQGSDNQQVIQEDKPQKPEARRETNVSPKARERAAEPEGFSEFWAIYPKRDGANPRATAEAAYAKALKGGAKPEEIRAGTEGYAAELRRKDKIGTEFVAQAASFLNQRRWRDYLEKPKPRADRVLTVSDEEWREEVAYWRRTYGRWSFNGVSEPPDSPRTRVPPHILAEFGLSRAA